MTAEAFPKTACTAENTAPLGRKGAALLALSFLAAVGYLFLHDFRQLPGVGLTVTQWTLLAAVGLCAGKKLRFRGNGQGILLLALAVLLGGSYGVFSNNSLRWMNLPVTCLLTAQAILALTGQNQHPALSAQGLWEGFRRAFAYLFSRWSAPFSALARRREKGRLYHALIGLLIALPIAGVAMALLSSADSVFAGAVQAGIAGLARLDGDVILKLVFLLPLTLALFSFLFSTLFPGGTMCDMRAGRTPPLIPSVILSALSLVYALFCYVQIRYLFGGAESVRMAGGYAEYARSGFFQLVLLAFLTLALILPALTLCRQSRAVRALCAVTAALTGVIDASAFFRMRLYIGAYGLSLLRVLTLWAMAMILLALLAVLVKCLRPAVRICPLLAAVVLSSWVLLNYANPDRIVAESQVARINAGEADVSALRSLPWSPDYLPAIEKIADKAARREARDFLIPPADGEKPLAPGFYEWSLDHLLLPR